MLFKVPGPCTVTFAANLLGHTREGIRITVRTEWGPIRSDWAGGSPADYSYGGKSVIVEATLQDMEKLKSAKKGNAFFPGLLFGGFGLAAVGSLASEVGKPLTIVDRYGETWQAPKAVMTDPASINLVSTEELGFPCVWYITAYNTVGSFFKKLPIYLPSGTNPKLGAKG